ADAAERREHGRNAAMHACRQSQPDNAGIARSERSEMANIREFRFDLIMGVDSKEINGRPGVLKIRQTINLARLL
ncbi:MAG TPA: hypothetical protein PKD05_14085, partial [Candidatus Melainabacteria bacterium]|nr:hypothetical protein [Candidatus Melainabacteria bacterium]